MKKSIIENKFFSLGLGVVLFFALWFLLSAVIGQQTLIFPSPLETFAYLGKLLSSSYIYRCLGVTLLKTLIGFAISLVLAAIFGILAGYNHWLKNLFKPTMVFLKSVPTAALVFLFLVLVGVKNAPVCLVVLISFPILYEAFVGGIENIPNEIIWASRIDGARFKTRLFRIVLPSIFPYLMVGFASSFSLSFKIEIMAEVISGDTGVGLGSAIVSAQKNNPADMAPIFAYAFIAVVMVFILSLIFSILGNAFKKKMR